MNPNSPSLMWLDARETVDVVELSRVSGMNTAELNELMEYGALTPLDEAAVVGRFSAECVVPLRTASRLRRDFDLDLFAVAVLLDYLNRIEVLERRIRTLQAHA